MVEPSQILLFLYSTGTGTIVHQRVYGAHRRFEPTGSPPRL